MHSRAASSTAAACRCRTFIAISPLNTPDREGETFAGTMVPGAPAADAPVEGAGAPWLLDHLHDGFTLLAFGDADPANGRRSACARPDSLAVSLQVGGDAADGDAAARSRGLLRERYDGRPGTCYLLRPDQHVCARWRRFDVDDVRAAIRRATCND